MNRIKNIKFNGVLNLIVVSLFSLSLICLGGCEAMKKKFIRKHKGEQEEEVNVVFEPKEYPWQEFTNEQLYQNHYLLWKSWKQELSEALQEGVNHKKQKESAKEMIVNLEAMRLLLQSDYQKGLEIFIRKARIINDRIYEGRLHNNDLSILKSNLETLEKNVRKDYNFKKVKNFIKK